MELLLHLLLLRQQMWAIAFETKEYERNKWPIRTKINFKKVGRRLEDQEESEIEYEDEDHEEHGL